MEDTLENPRTTPWLITGGELRNDAPFFIPLGLIFGITQFIGYRHFNKASWGNDLVLEHIPFNTLLLLVIALWIAKWLTARFDIQWARRMIHHVSSRAVSFASVSATTMFGFTIVTALSGAYVHALVFLVFCMYLASLSEIAANPLWGHSKAYGAALAVVIMLPILFRFWEVGT